MFAGTENNMMPFLASFFLTVFLFYYTHNRINCSAETKPQLLRMTRLYIEKPGVIIMKKKNILLQCIPFVILFGFLIGTYVEFTRSVTEKENDMNQHLAVIKSNINEITNYNFSKMVGVTTYLSVNNDIDIEKLDYFVQQVVDSDNNIISNLGIFDDTTAVYLYPYEPNVEMSNINLLDIPSQRDDALIVKERLEVVITPPVELVQGGLGIMTRMPIILSDGTYWGQLGYMMVYQDVIDKLSTNTDMYTYKITQHNNDGSFHVVYDSGFEDYYYLVDSHNVELPSGYWSVQVGYNNVFELLSPVLYILLSAAILLFILSIYIIHKLNLQNAKLLDVSQRDELTGLKNRRAVKELLETFNSALMLDVDDFKKINDTYGHYTGDEILLQLSRRLESILRDDDVVVRWGGEEFVVLMTSVDKESVLVVANRVLTIFKEPFTIEKEVIHVTASIGVASSWNNSTIRMNKIIKAADDEMYVSKKNGKNRISVYNGEIL